MEKFKELFQRRISPSAPLPEIDPLIYSPFRCRLTGYIKADGILKQEWIKELIKKISVVIACHISSSVKGWEQCAPLLAAALKILFSKNLLFSSSHAYLTSRRLFSLIEKNYISLLSYIPSSLDSLMVNAEHKWEFDINQKGATIVHYSVKCVIEPYDYKNYDSELMAGYEPFPDAYKYYESVCDEVFLKNSERPMNPDKVLQTLTGESGRLKKLLLSKYIPDINFDWGNNSHHRNNLVHMEKDKNA